jgi:hypothetical protein
VTTSIDHQASFDGWTPALMEQLVRVRSRYPHAYDRLWRDERLLRYVYWHGARSHPDFNLIGSWNDADIKAEIELWSRAWRQDLGDEDVIATVRSQLEERFGFGLTSATAFATNLGLASARFPVWNELTGSLLPQVLGRLEIASATDHESQSAGTGVGYSYRAKDDSARVDLYIYSGGEHDLGDGIEDPRVRAKFEDTWDGLQSHYQLSQAKVPMQQGPMVEKLRDPLGREFTFFSVLFSVPTKTYDVMTQLSITAFCNAFLKVRFSFPAIDLEADSIPDTLRESIELFNADLAAFCCHFSRLYG